MYWILAAIFLVMALAVPKLRPLGVGGCIVLGLLLAWGMVERWRGGDAVRTPSVEERARPRAPVAARQAVPLDLIAAENLRLTGNGAPFELQGRIANASPDMVLGSVTIRVSRQDCYPGAPDPGGCVLLWQHPQWIDISVPPRQARDFTVSIWMRGAPPRPRGTVQDTFEVVAALGTAGQDR